MKHAASFSRFQLTSTTHRLLALVCTAILLLLLCIPLSAEEGFLVSVPHYANGPDLGIVNPQYIYTCSDDAVVVVSLVTFVPYDIHYYDLGAITKLDNNGNLLWIKYFPDIVEWITGLGIDENDTVSFIAGDFMDPGQRYLVHVDSNGDMTEMPLDLGDLYVSDLSEGLRTASGDFIVIGRVVQNWSPYQSPLAFFRISPDAEVLVSSFIPPDSTMVHDITVYDAEIEAGGTVLISCEINPNKIELLRLDMDGALIERIQLDNCDYFPLLYRSPESEYTIATYSEGIPSSLDRIAHIAWVAEDDITYHTVLEPAFGYGYSMTTIDNDVYIVSFLNSMSNIWLSRYNYTDVYEHVWAWNHPDLYFNSGGEQHIHRLLSSTQNGCIYVAGYRNYRLVVAKLLPTGQVPIEDDIATPPLQKISAYPNPMKEYVVLKIDYASPAEASASLEVYNIKGQLVRTLESSRSGEYIWDGYDNKGRACSTGIYFIRDSKGIYKQTKVIKIK